MESDRSAADELDQLRSAYRTILEILKLIDKAKICLQQRDYGSAEGWLNSVEYTAKLGREHVEKPGKARGREMANKTAEALSRRSNR